MGLINVGHVLRFISHMKIYIYTYIHIYIYIYISMYTQTLRTPFACLISA